MSGSKKQEINGKAFEYAILQALENFLVSNNIKVEIKDSPSVINAKTKYLSLSLNEQNDFTLSAQKGIEHISHLEPLLLNPSNETIELTIQCDNKGSSGDVRDVLIVRVNQTWEIGISAKNNNSYIKSIRINPDKDFFEDIVGIKSSSSFEKAMLNLKTTLLSYVGQKWIDVPKHIKEVDIYKSTLSVFNDELLKQASSNPLFAEQITKYILGINDYYKIKRDKKSVVIEALNIHGTLNKPFGQFKSKGHVPKYKHPTRVIESSFLQKDGQVNTLKVVFDNGLSLSLRIHNGDTLVKKCGLKLEVKIESYPITLYNHRIFI